MWELLEALQRIIKRYIVSEQTITSVISPGDTTFDVQNGRRFTCGDKVVVFEEGGTEGEILEVKEVVDHTITLYTGFVESWPIGSKAQKLVGNQWCKGIYIGDPPVIGRYPAITIAPMNVNTEYLTIAGTSEKYAIEISVYIEAAHFEEAMEFQIKAAEAIKEGLFKTLYPLVAPYLQTTLSEDVDSEDMVIRVADNSKIGNYGMVWLENDSHSVMIRPLCVDQNGVVELAFAPGVSFSSGDDVILPVRHFYDNIAHEIDYAYVLKDTLLKAAKISYFATEERWRHRPNYDLLLR